MNSCFDQLLKFIGWLATDISPILQAAVSVIGLIGLWFVYLQVRDARAEAEAGRHRARREAAYSMVDGVMLVQLETNAYEACKKAGVKFPAKLTAADVAVFRNDVHAYLAVKAILVVLEKIALAYNEEYSERIVIERTYGPVIVGYWAA